MVWVRDTCEHHNNTLLLPDWWRQRPFPLSRGAATEVSHAARLIAGGSFQRNWSFILFVYLFPFNGSGSLPTHGGP